jgi:hypothetical protein
MAQNGHFGSHMPGELGGLGMNNPGLQGPQTAYPGQPMPMAAPDLNAFQQQQSAAMAALAQAAQNRGMRPSSGGESFSADGAIRPPAAARPSSLNLMGINPAEFPFDFRLLPYLQHVDELSKLHTPDCRVDRSSPKYLRRCSKCSSICRTLKGWEGRCRLE